MGETIMLDVAKRDIVGKKVKTLRQEGVIPGVVYGPTYVEPVAVQVEWAKLRPVLSEAGGTSLIDLNVDGSSVSVLVRSVQRHPVRRDVVHVDFYAVDVNATIRTTVPVHLSNPEAASKRLQAKLFQPLNRIEIESLPGDIPSRVTVDLSVLKKAGENLTVADIPAIKGVKFLADEDVVVVRTISFAAIAAEEDMEAEEDFGASGAEIGEVEVIGRGRDEDDFDDEG